MCLWNANPHFFLPQPIRASQEGPGIVQVGEETKGTATDSCAQHSKYENSVDAQLVHVFTKQGTTHEHGQVDDTKHGPIF